MNYLSANATAFGVTESDFQRVIITDSYTSDGITHVYLQQTFNGLPIADANASVHVAANGQIIAAHANFVPNLVHPPIQMPVIPDIPQNSALQLYAAAVGAD